MEKVDRGSSTDCWLWTASTDGDGYGRFKIGGHVGRMVGAHRVAYELLVGPIPEGLDIDHTCHNADESCAGGRSCVHRRCVNPEHLEPVTRSENVLAGRGLSAQRARQSECAKGHPLGARAPWQRQRCCAICRDARAAARRAA